jgi:hypothetical protein
MTGRDLRWLRRRTTVDDLLDDGIENSSDLKNARLRDDSDQAVATPASHRGRVARADFPAPSRRAPVSMFGLLLGAVFIAAGAILIVTPIDMLVKHVRIRYLPTTIEHVTPATSRMYGVALSAAGIAIFGFALYRGRR